MKALIKYIEITEKIRIAKWNRSDLSDENGMNMALPKWLPEMVRYIPSGKHTKNYGKSPFFYGKTHYFYGHVQ